MSSRTRDRARRGDVQGLRPAAQDRGRQRRTQAPSARREGLSRRAIRSRSSSAAASTAPASPATPPAAACGPPVREGRSRAGHLLALRQAGPWRPALPRVLRVPAGARGADRARGAAARRRRTSSGRCASCCRTAPSSGRPGSSGSASSSTTISAAASACRGTRTLEPAPRPGRHADQAPNSRSAFEYSDCWVDDARLVVLNALDAAAARRHGPHPHGRCIGAPPRRRLLAGRHPGRARRASAARFRARALVNAAGPWVEDVIGQRRRRQFSAARAPGQGQPYRRAASSGTGRRPICCRTTTSA